MCNLLNRRIQSYLNDHIYQFTIPFRFPKSTGIWLQTVFWQWNSWTGAKSMMWNIWKRIIFHQKTSLENLGIYTQKWFLFRFDFSNFKFILVSFYLSYDEYNQVFGWVNLLMPRQWPRIKNFCSECWTYWELPKAKKIP